MAAVRRSIVTVALLATLLPACRGFGSPCGEPQPPPPGPFCTGAWCSVPGATVNHHNVFAAAAAVSADMMWAVGSWRAGSGRTPCPEGPANLGPPRPLIERWNGQAWVEVVPGLPTPADPFAPGGAELSAVGASGPNSAWAFGASDSGVPLALRWNGRSWSSFDLPRIPSPRTHVAIRSVAALSDRDAWAVGSIDASSVGESALALHWDGRRWTAVPLPAPAYSRSIPGDSSLSDVVALGTDDVWAVGAVSRRDVQDAILPSHPLSLHWDGARWRTVPTPDLPGALGNGDFAAAAASGPNDVWAVGTRSGLRPGALITLAEHWDGHAWSIVPTPNFGTGGSLSAVAAGRGGTWAFGSGEQGLVTLRWDGTSWARVPAPNVPGVGNSIDDAVSVGQEVWAVGSHGYVGAREAALTLRLRAGWVP